MRDFYPRSPNISFWSNKEKSSIRLSISLLDALNYPKYIRILVNSETKEIAFQASNKKDNKALRILYTKNSPVAGALVSSKVTILRIYDVCGWELQRSYNCRKHYVAENNIHVFDLKEAKDVTKPRNEEKSKEE